MEPKIAISQAIEETGSFKRERRASFSAVRALRSLSISSQISSSSEADSPPAQWRRALLRKSRVPSLTPDLARNLSKSSTEDNRTSTSTRPTSPSGTCSQGTSISGDHVSVIKFGALQAESSLLKTKKEHYLVLTPSALFKFKSRAAALEQFPQASASANVAETCSPAPSLLSSKGSLGSSKDFKHLKAGAEVHIPLERIVSVFKDEGTRPCFGIEMWWRDPNEITIFSRLELDFGLPEDRDDWLKQIRHATRLRCKSIPDERAPPDIELIFKQIVEAKPRQRNHSQLDIFPVIPRRVYARPGANSGEVKKHWRDGSSFYLALSKNSCLLAQFVRSGGQTIHKDLVQFGLASLSRANASLNDERFDLVFRLPMDRPERLDLSSRHHRTILSKLFKADTYLKPAWPLWTRREVFVIDGESQPIHLPEGEDYGGFKRTLEAFLEAYHCADVNWTVQWKDARYQPEFRLLPPTRRSQYSAYQLLAVFRALRYNDFFKSLSFRDIDFSSLSWLSDNSKRLESTIWISRTGRRSLTRAEYDLVENSSVLFQEIVALLIASESVKHLDLRNVLRKCRPPASGPNAESLYSPSKQVCEIVPPIVLLWKSQQTRCNSIDLSGNPFGPTDVAGISRVLRNRPGFLKALSCSRCQINEQGLETLCEGLQEQRSSLEVLDLSHNSARLEAAVLSQTLNGAPKLQQLNIAYCVKGAPDGSLFLPWNTNPSLDPWRLERIDLSGWKMNFDTLAAILKYLELGESQCLRRLVLNNCGLTGDMATALLCRLGKGRDVDLSLNENPLETGSIDWIDLIEGNETPRMLHLDMIEFLHQRNFHRLLTALTRNKTIEFLSMVGTGPPAGANSEMSEALFKFFKENDTLRFLDLSGYSGKLEDSQMGWGLSGALSGLMQNASLRQLRIRNHDLGAAEDVTELCRVLATNEGLAMLDCQNNNFNHHQFGKLVHALGHNHRLISFPWSDADRDCALQQEKRVFIKTLGQPGKPPPSTLSKSAESRLAGLLKWVKEYWESEAKKVEDIIRRNRDNLANGLLEFDSEYLETWEDRNLPSWLTLKSRTPVKTEELNRLSVISLDMPSSTLASSPALPALPVLPALPAIPAIDISETASESFLGTYIIKEESSASNRTSPFKSNTHHYAAPLHNGGPTTPPGYTTPLHGGGSTTSLASSLTSPPEIHHQRVVEDLTLDTW
ncbi:hypothetical protein DL762_007274 [Monosporascus cannonballus]|uniref:PH domain-containing protein n=1 Tax=Monosporascus cannonballus TaxID=155416 RepID=A0ABY0GZS7_9PEZI|nr:hypothetical protein DL762_007274 [Monosporascus cannonballus]